MLHVLKSCCCARVRVLIALQFAQLDGAETHGQSDGELREELVFEVFIAETGVCCEHARCWRGVELDGDRGIECWPAHGELLVSLLLQPVEFHLMGEIWIDHITQLTWECG